MRGRGRPWHPALSFPVPEQGPISVSELAVEAQPLEEILHEAEIAKLAGLNATLPIGARGSSREMAFGPGRLAELRS